MGLVVDDRVVIRVMRIGLCAHFVEVLVRRGRISDGIEDGARVVNGLTFGVLDLAGYSSIARAFGANAVVITCVVMIAVKLLARFLRSLFLVFSTVRQLSEELDATSMSTTRESKPNRKLIGFQKVVVDSPL